MVDASLDVYLMNVWINLFLEQVSLAIIYYKEHSKKFEEISKKSFKKR